MASIFKIEQRCVGKIGELIVVIGIPYSFTRTITNIDFCIHSGIRTVFGHVGGDRHGCSSDRFSIGKMDDAIDQILEVVAIPYLDIDARASIAERGNVGRGKRGKKHQQHQENWLRFRVCFL